MSATPYLCDPRAGKKRYNSARHPTMSASDFDPQRVRDSWQAPRAGSDYAGRRWRSSRASGRDPAIVARAMSRHAPDLAGQTVLDVPSGTGRLRTTIEETGARYVGLDVSAPMLAEGLGSDRVQASAWALPFRSNTFGAVVCCRLLHHVREQDSRAALLGELVRVCHGPVLVSFWDSASWPALRRRKGWRRAAHPDSRTAISRDQLEGLVRAAGAQPLRFYSSLRFISQQTFLVLQRSSKAGG